MRRVILLILACATLFPSLAQAYDVLVLQSRRDPAYEEVLKGFRAENKASLRVVVLSDYAETDVVRIVREDHPRLILAVGDAALSAARKVQHTPVIALMALGIHTFRGSPTNLTGIGMFAAPDHYIAIFQAMKSRRVGVIHNPAKTGWYLRQARLAAEKAGIELVVREVSVPRDTLAQLSSLSSKVDTLWMLPDTTAVTRETTETYFRFGQDQAIPVVSFAGSYLGLGAAAVVEIDRTELGRQAGDMAAALLNDGRGANHQVGVPQRVSIRTNPGVVKRLGLDYEGLNKLSNR
jgi:putative tryptophan/tyrosine transport system substrate-binding protein